jgi:hypothetical protein
MGQKRMVTEAPTCPDRDHPRPGGGDGGGGGVSTRVVTTVSWWWMMASGDARGPHP